MQRTPLGGIDEVVKEHEMHARDHEIELKHFELYQEYEKDLRSRVDTIAKGIFLLSGGALTLSINIFTQPNHPTVSVAELVWLREAWFALFASVALMVTVQLLILIRASRYADAWSRKLNKVKSDFPKQTFSGYVAWGLGLSGIGAFMFGFFMLAYVSISVLK